MIARYMILGLCLHSVSSTIFSRFHKDSDVHISRNALIQGDVRIGSDSIVRDGVRIIAEAGPIIIGSDNIIENDVQILNLLSGNNSGKAMIIGSDNKFLTGAYIEAERIGSDNVFGKNCKVGRNVEIKSDCKIQERCEITLIPPKPEHPEQNRQNVQIGSDTVLGGKCEFQGEVSIGQDTSIKNGVRIIAEAGPIYIGSDTVFNKNVNILNLRQLNDSGTRKMYIGRDNNFGDNAYIEAERIGNDNAFRSNCKIGRNIEIKSDCAILEGCEMTSIPADGSQNKQKVLIESHGIYGGKCQFQGDVTIGAVSDVKYGVQIRAEAGPIIIGAATVINKTVTLLNSKQNASGLQTMNIGNANSFEDGAYIEALKMGDYNILKSKCKIGKYTELKNWCTVGEGCEITSNEVIPDRTEFFGANCERRINAEVPFQYPKTVRSVVMLGDMIFINRKLLPVRSHNVRVINNAIFIDGKQVN